MKILVLCTSNSCRSQMAEAILKSFDPNLDVFSAGTKPSIQVHPFAIQVMKEIGIDISSNRPKSVDLFLKKSFNYVITVCDHAKETCPIFIGKVTNRLHLAFDDPSDAAGTIEDIYTKFRSVRDEIKNKFYKFYSENLRAN